MYLSSSTGLSLRVLLLRLKHTTVNTATITSTMRTADIGSTVANTVGSTAGGAVVEPLDEGSGARR